VVEAIVNPNAAIAFGFSAELFVTKRNEPHIGFLQADGQTVSMRDGYGRVRTFGREELASRVPLNSSLMPEPLALALSEQDVADIAAFLMER
jgi:putative heme-binding domain-containing protein